MAIPKVIHYCWFGGKPKPKLAEKCLKSWKKYCPDYEIVEWNEGNFDLSTAPHYVQQAMAAGRWAFVTDYVRLREVSVGYTFPLPASCPLKQLRLSAFGRNLGVWGPDTKHYDPEVAVISAGNVQGLESGASPSTANFGLTLQVKL